MTCHGKKGFGTQNSNGTNQKITTIARTRELDIENLQTNVGNDWTVRTSRKKNPKIDIPKKAEGIPVSSHHQ